MPKMGEQTVQRPMAKRKMPTGAIGATALLLLASAGSVHSESAKSIDDLVDTHTVVSASKENGKIYLLFVNGKDVQQCTLTHVGPSNREFSSAKLNQGDWTVTCRRLTPSREGGQYP
ncbi:MAG TPA: hypothetical protein VE131_14555 [Terriglobales bacterium]|nr:hypothetical protein [Terriglobales bacterium]